MVSAHRYCWTIHFGAIPKGKWVCHHCDNPPCCNPSHLFLGTPSDNTRDMLRKGRRPSRKGTKHPLAKLTDENVVDIRRQHRNGKTMYRIAKDTGMSAGQIRRIIFRKNWTHI